MTYDDVHDLRKIIWKEDKKVMPRRKTVKCTCSVHT